ncbi:MAG: chemotaxis protein CheA [Oscillospiraceae bacterium]|nr:chemotaxis protein CheA [Oscillospiraceae bacterium]
MKNFYNSESMMEIFLLEVGEQLESLDDLLLCIEKKDDLDKNSSQAFNKDDIENIFRIMHTVKGACAMMGFDYMATVSHKLEDLFSLIRSNKYNNDRNINLFNILFDSCDFLKESIEIIKKGDSPNTDIDDIITSIDTFLEDITVFYQDNNSALEENTDKKTLLNKHIHDLNIISKSNLNNKENIPEIGINDYSKSFTKSKENILENNNTVLNNKKGSIRVYFDEDSGMENLRAFLLIESLKDICYNLEYYPKNIENNPETCIDIVKDGFFLSFTNIENMKIIEKTIESSINVKTYEVVDSRLFDKFNDRYTQENIPKIPTLSKSIVENLMDGSLYNDLDRDDFNSIKNSKQNLINVNLLKLDKIMDIVGEIVIAESIISSNTEIKSLKIDGFTKSFMNLRKLISELQNDIMSIRMVPISLVFHKMHRVVRDMSKKLNKSIDLILVGEDTEVDKSIIDILSDPLIHLIRNSIDHGIEKYNDRIKAKKQEKGRIVLFSQNTGGEIVIIVSDDGKGIDEKIIIEEATKNRLLTKPISEYSKKEILSLILMPGFSTTNSVTEFSGRGVGLDIVNKNIESIGGNITVDSDIGMGTTIIIKIPITLAIISGLEICIGSQRYIIPLNYINKSFRVSKEDIIISSNGDEKIYKSDNIYNIIRLHEIYGIDTTILNLIDGIILEVEVDGCRYCLFVDSVSGEGQFVVKPIPKYLNKFDIKKSGIAGCTILGDGSISLILDVYSLFNI